MIDTAVTACRNKCRNIRKHCYVTADITLTGFYYTVRYISACTVFAVTTHFSLVTAVVTADIRAP